MTLIERLEKAGEGSRELDGMLARHFGWHRVEPRFVRNKAGGWIAPEDFLGVNSDGSPRLDSLRGTDIHRDPPRLSQSLDAALALAERLGLDVLAITNEAVEGLAVSGWSSSLRTLVPELARHACLAVLRATQEQAS